MKKLLMAILVTVFCSATLYGENNDSIEQENNTSKSDESTKKDRITKQIEKQMKREEKFAREQQFYKGENHNLSYAEVNKDSIDSVPLIEPDYDFNMDDVYD